MIRPRPQQKPALYTSLFIRSLADSIGGLMASETRLPAIPGMTVGIAGTQLLQKWRSNIKIN